MSTFSEYHARIVARVYCVGAVTQLILGNVLSTSFFFLGALFLVAVVLLYTDVPSNCNCIIEKVNDRGLCVCVVFLP
jgi:hypothetical protein